MANRILFALAASLLTCAAYAVEADKPPSNSAEEAEENLTALQTLNACTRLVPEERLFLSGTLRVRKPHGVVLQETPCKLLLDWGAKTPNAEVMFLDKTGQTLQERVILERPCNANARIRVQKPDGSSQEESPTFAGRVRGTDMTWLDISLDFLWWTDVRFADEPRGKSRNGRDCDILVAVPPYPIPGCAAMKIWVDRKLRCLMQGEQLNPQGKPSRRFWVQRVKKTGDRWMIKDLEVESLGSGHRTQLLVDDVSRP